MGRGSGSSSTEQVYSDLDLLLLCVFLMKEGNVHLLSSCTHSPTAEVYFVV